MRRNHANYKLRLLGPSSRALRLDPIPIWTNQASFISPSRASAVISYISYTYLSSSSRAPYSTFCSKFIRSFFCLNLHEDLKRLTSKTDDPQAGQFRALRLAITSDISPASSHQIRSQWSHQLGVSLSLPPPHQGQRLHLHGLPPESGESIPLGPVSSDHRLAQWSAASEQWIQLAWRN